MTASVTVASAGLHVMDRWTDAVVDGLLAAGAGDPDLSGSLTGGRFEVTMTVRAPDAATAERVGSEAVQAALAAAAMSGLTVRAVSVSAAAAGPP